MTEEKAGDLYNDLSPERCEEFASVVDRLGSLTLATQKTGRGVVYRYEVYRLTADDETLEAFHEAFGGGIYQNGQESGSIWKVSGQGCREMLSRLESYLVRRREAVAALREIRRALGDDPVVEDDVSRETRVAEAIERFQQVSKGLRSTRGYRGPTISEEEIS